MAPIQKAQLQPITLMKPEIGGPRIGPKVVAAYVKCENVSYPLLVFEYADHKDGHTPSPADRIMIHIRADPTNDRNRTRPSHTHEQPKDDQSGEVRRYCRCN